MTYRKEHGQRPRLRHQYGGEPYLIQTNPEEVGHRCCKCRRKMIFLASVANEAPEQTQFFGYDDVQVIYEIR